MTKRFLIVSLFARVQHRFCWSQSRPVDTGAFGASALQIFLCPQNWVVPRKICLKQTIKCTLPQQTLKPGYGPVSKCINHSKTLLGRPCSLECCGIFEFDVRTPPCEYTRIIRNPLTN